MARRRKGNPVHGWINLDKPLGLSSTQALAKVRRILNAQKAGHGGTLDPLASGILPIALGEATKTVAFAQDGIKTYSFTVTWGEQRSTDDAEGEVIAQSDVRPSPDAIANVLSGYIGDIEQVPPKFSALKIDGQRAYDLARDGQEFEIKTREVHVESLDLLEAREGEADLRVVCGKGTYVRAIARDIAFDLGTYGYVSMLKREQVGVFTLDDAISLDKLEEMGHIAALDTALMPVDSVLDDIPALSLTTQETARLRNGQKLSFVSKGDFHRLDEILEDAGDNAVLALALHEDQPVGLIEVLGPNIRSVRLFNL